MKHLCSLLLFALGCSGAGQPSPEFAAAQRALVEVQERTLDPTFRDPAFRPVLTLLRLVPRGAREYASAQELIAEIDAAQRAPVEHAAQVAGAQAADLAAERSAAEAARPAKERQEAAERQVRELGEAAMEQQRAIPVVDPAEFKARQEKLDEIRRGRR